MVLNATVNQVDAERLRLGMKATIRLDAYPELEACRRSLMGIGAMSKTSTFRAGYVGEIPVRHQDRKDGHAGDSRSHGQRRNRPCGRESTALMVPRSAVFDEEGGSYVFVQNPEGWTQEEGRSGAHQFHPCGGSLRRAKGRHRSDCNGPCNSSPAALRRRHILPTHREYLCHRKIKGPKRAWANRIPRRVKTITWTFGPAAVRGRRFRRIPLHRHHRSGSRRWRARGAAIS